MLIKIEHKDGEAWMEAEDVGVIVRRGGKLKIFARRRPGMTWEMDTDEEVAKRFIREVNAAKERRLGLLDVATERQLCDLLEKANALMARKARQW